MVRAMWISAAQGVMLWGLVLLSPADAQGSRPLDDVHWQDAQELIDRFEQTRRASTESGPSLASLASALLRDRESDFYGRYKGDVYLSQNFHKLNNREKRELVDVIGDHGRELVLFARLMSQLGKVDDELDTAIMAAATKMARRQDSDWSHALDREELDPVALRVLASSGDHCARALLDRAFSEAERTSPSAGASPQTGEAPYELLADLLPSLGRDVLGAADLDRLEAMVLTPTRPVKHRVAYVNAIAKKGPSAIPMLERLEQRLYAADESSRRLQELVARKLAEVRPKRATASREADAGVDLGPLLVALLAFFAGVGGVGAAFAKRLFGGVVMLPLCAVLTVIALDMEFGRPEPPEGVDAPPDAAAVTTLLACINLAVAGLGLFQLVGVKPWRTGLFARSAKRAQEARRAQAVPETLPDKQKTKDSVRLEHSFRDIGRLLAGHPGEGESGRVKKQASPET